MYRKLNLHAFIYRLNLAAKKNNKNTKRRNGLHFDRIHEKLNYPKRFTDNIEKKIKDDLFFIKTIGLGPQQFHCDSHVLVAYFSTVLYAACGRSYKILQACLLQVICKYRIHILHLHVC